jgi:hypothetical protein
MGNAAAWERGLPTCGFDAFEQRARHAFFRTPHV